MNGLSELRFNASHLSITTNTLQKVKQLINGNEIWDTLDLILGLQNKIIFILIL